MCNLYSMTRAREAVLRLFRVSDNRAEQLDLLPAIFPARMAPVVRQAADGERELVNLSWGFVLQQKDRAPKRVTNVRDDKVLASPFWKESFEMRRCLVPASSFAEPKEVTPATWHWFALRGDDARPLFAFPGIWRRYKGPLRKNGEPVEVDVFAFMTTLPNALVATINHERMPVLLTKPHQFDTWLSGSPTEAYGLVHSHDPARMRMVQSGFAKDDLLAA
jgi:putative SOS response-associated peptidase YedK